MGPIQTLLFVLVLLFTPVILLGALLADLIQPLLPEGFGLGQITPPTTLFNARDAASNLPSVLFYIILGALLVFELFVLGVMVWMRHQERRRMRARPARHSRSARSSSRHPAREREAPTGRPEPCAHPLPLDDPAGAYLAALSSLDRDGRWARRPNETPAAHAGRIRPDGMDGRRVRATGGRLPAGPLRRAATLRPRAPAFGTPPASAPELAGPVLNPTIR